MMGRFLSLLPGSRASRDEAVMAKVEILGEVLRPVTDPVVMERAIQQIIQTGRTESQGRTNALGTHARLAVRSPGT
jgi:hypothetical protein